ncbi:MAG TPA: polyprenyl synthetase family protein, partial [Anaerolineales bacterium]|nr:polyprenyl synthetase family protein [Anaerolineales bacterium]
GEHVRLGAGRAANLATAFLAAGGEALSASLCEPERLVRAQAALAEGVGRVAVGQHLDVGGAEDEAAYWRIAAAKSGAFFGLAFHLGALLSPASFDEGLALEAVGALYGEMVQIHDDLRDCLEAPAGPDWRAGRLTLPMLYAQVVPHPERDRFCERRAEIAALLEVDASAEEIAPVLAEAQAMLVRCGAISYGLDQILRRDAEARGRLASIAQQTQGVTRVLDEIVAPVRALLMGAEAHRA